MKIKYKVLICLLCVCLIGIGMLPLTGVDAYIPDPANTDRINDTVATAIGEDGISPNPYDALFVGRSTNPQNLVYCIRRLGGFPYNSPYDKNTNIQSVFNRLGWSVDQINAVELALLFTYRSQSTTGSIDYHKAAASQNLVWEIEAGKTDFNFNSQSPYYTTLSTASKEFYTQILSNVRAHIDHPTFSSTISDGAPTHIMKWNDTNRRYEVSFTEEVLGSNLVIVGNSEVGLTKNGNTYTFYSTNSNLKDYLVTLKKDIGDRDPSRIAIYTGGYYSDGSEHQPVIASSEYNPIIYFSKFTIQSDAYVYIKKQVPSGYNADGATFGLYYTEADARTNTNRITSLTINQGQTVKYKISLDNIQNGKIWAKELSGPTQTGDFDWVIDSTPQSVPISENNSESNPATFNFENKTTEYGWVTVEKTVRQKDKTTNTLNVSPKGARYAVFDTRAHAQAYITSGSTTGILGLIGIDENGKGAANVTNANEKAAIRIPLAQTGTNTWETKKVYILEVKLPDARAENFEWDRSELSNIYEKEISRTSTPTQPVVVNSRNYYDVTLPLTITKNITGATSEALRQAGTSGKFVFTVKNTTDNINLGDFEITFSVGQITNSVNNIKVIVGKTYSVTEKSVPTGVTRDTNPKTITITNNHINNPAMVTFNNKVESTPVKVNKQSDLNGILDSIPVSATFTIYKNENLTTVAKDVNGNNAVLTLTKGNLTTNSVELLPGDYWIDESNINPSDYAKPSTLPLKFTITGKETSDKTITVKNHFKRGTGYVIKTSNRPELSEYVVKGAEFTLYTNSAKTTIAKDVWGNNAVLKVGENGISNTLTLKPGNYYIKETVVPKGFSEYISNKPIEIKDGEETKIEIENELAPGKGKVKKNY